MFPIRKDSRMGMIAKTVKVIINLASAARTGCYSPANGSPPEMRGDGDELQSDYGVVLNLALDTLNARYGKIVVSLGMWNPPKGGHVGGKISYTRIPTAEDFW